MCKLFTLKYSFMILAHDTIHFMMNSLRTVILIFSLSHRKTGLEAISKWVTVTWILDVFLSVHNLVMEVRLGYPLKWIPHFYK